MLFHTLRIYQNAVNEHNDELVQLRHENRVQEVYEMCGAFINPNDMTRYS
jgi:hypothetical protein